jgi:hypothetical protein
MNSKSGCFNLIVNLVAPFLSYNHKLEGDVSPRLASSGLRFMIRAAIIGGYSTFLRATPQDSRLSEDQSKPVYMDHIARYVLYTKGYLSYDRRRHGSCSIRSLPQRPQTREGTLFRIPIDASVKAVTMVLALQYKMPELTLPHRPVADTSG